MFVLHLCHVFHMNYGSHCKTSNVFRLSLFLPNYVSSVKLTDVLNLNHSISDLPLRSSCQYRHTDDLALLYSDSSWSNVEEVLEKDMALICTKLTSRINLLHRLAGSSWGANTSTLHTSALALVYSCAE